MSLLRDWRNQHSWGRVCAVVALAVTVWRESNGADLQHVALWLGVATGSYGLSKGREVVALLKNVGAAAPTSQAGDPVVPGGLGSTSGGDNV